jgi:hypothetical protein
MCFATHWYLYSAVLDVNLNIKYMLWNAYIMLAERHVVVPLWRSVCMISKKKNGSSQIDWYVALLYKQQICIYRCVFAIDMCSAAHWVCYPLHRRNSEYQVYIMRCVLYVGWVTSSHTTVMIHLCLY